MGHWKMARSAPGGEEINPELMATREFPYPYSTPGAVALKAFARQLPEREGDFVEAIERAHLVECRNIADPEDLLAVAESLGADIPLMRDAMADPAIEQSVWRDHMDATGLGIHSTPTVEFAGGGLVVGAQPFEVFLAAFEAAAGAAGAANGKPVP